MTKSKYTKSMQKKARVTGVISLLLNVVPLIIFFFKGFAVGGTKEKLVISFTGMVALVLTALMFLMKHNFKRTIFWIVLLGITSVLDRLGSVFITMAICNIIDELFVTPMHNRYVTDYHTNKQIDKRGNPNEEQV